MVGNVRNNGPELLEPLPLDDPDRPVVGDRGLSDVRTVPTPHGDARLVTSAPATRSRRCCSATAPGPASTPTTWPRWPRRCPPRASPCTASSSRGGWPAGRSRPRRPRSTTALRAPPTTCGRTPSSWADARAGARSAARMRRDLGAAGVLALSFPLHPPGQPEKSRVAELAGCRRAGAGDPGGARPDGPSRGVPRRAPSWSSCPAADHGLKVPKSAPLSQEDVGGGGRGDPGVDRPRGHRRAERTRHGVRRVVDGRASRTRDARSARRVDPASRLAGDD